MAKRTKHSGAEIAAKLAQASDMQRQGKLQSEIAQTLGISIMTLHRWRKMSPKILAAPAFSAATEVANDSERSGRVAELQLENSRLRRLVTDLLLEKMNLQEALDSGQASPAKRQA